MPTVPFDTESEIAELVQNLLELQHQLLSHKDSHEERHILYSSAKSIIYKKQRRVNLLRALVYLTSETCDGLPNLGADSADDDTSDQPFRLDGRR